MPEIIEIRAGVARARLAPHLGGRITSVDLLGDDGIPRALLVPFPETTRTEELLHWPKGGLYPLVPYGNRIRGALLRFAGRDHALAPHPDAPPHSLHGPAHRRAWTVTSRETDRVVLTLEDGRNADWPYLYRARSETIVTPSALTVELTIENRDEEPMPAGIGLHPYFPSLATDVVACDAATIWPATADWLAASPHPREVALRGPRRLPAEGTTDYLSDWSGEAFVRREDGTTIRLTASPEFGHVVIFRPAGGAHLCIEPTTHAPDGFNLAEIGETRAGRVVLRPGERLSGRLTIALS